MNQADSVETIATNPTVAGCVAVSLYGIGAFTAWFFGGTPEEALGQIALGGVVVFTVMVAIRGFGGLLRRGRTNSALAIGTDLAILLACMVIIVLVGLAVGEGDGALYGMVVSAGFLVPAMIVVSLLVEIAVRQVWATRVSIALAGLFGLVSLVIYAVNLTP